MKKNKFNRIITIQQMIIYISIMYVVFLTVKYYYPWIYTYLFGEFKTSHFIKPNNGYSLNINDKYFYLSFISETIRLITTLIVLLIVLFNIQRVLTNFKKYIFFKETNSKYLIKSSNLLVFLSVILLALDLIVHHNYFISYFGTIFIASCLFVLGYVFNEAHKQKQENDLTI